MKGFFAALVPSFTLILAASQSMAGSFTTLQYVDGSVSTIVLNGSQLYAGGSFGLAGGHITHNIARWDGSSWSALGDGLNGQVRAIAIMPTGEIYAGGDFTSVSGYAGANYLAKWVNGNPSWIPVTSALSGPVHALAVSGSTLYLGGQFSVGGSHVATWNGYTLASVGNGLNNTVRALVFNGSDLYAGGDFTSVTGYTGANYFAKFAPPNPTWIPLTSALNGAVCAFAVSSGTIYLGGEFSSPGSHVAKWNGYTLSAMGNGLNGPVYALTLVNNSLYAGGGFTDVTGYTGANYFAKWTDPNPSWIPLTTCLDGAVRAMAPSGANIHLGGDFYSICGVGSPLHIVRADGF